MRFVTDSNPMVYFWFPWQRAGIIITTKLCTIVGTIPCAGRFSKLSLHLQKGRPQVPRLSGFFIVCELGFRLR